MASPSTRLRLGRVVEKPDEICSSLFPLDGQRRGHNSKPTTFAGLRVHRVYSSSSVNPKASM